MRWVFVGLLVILLGYVGYTLVHKEGGELSTGKAKPQPTTQPHSIAQGEITQETLFVPYWQMPLDNLSDSFRTQAPKRLMYFGVGATKNGLNTTDPGYLTLQNSWSKIDGYTSVLTLRMLDNDVNEYIMEHTDSRSTLISQTVSLAQEFGFSGVALDLEQVSVFDTDTKDKINQFVESFYNKTQETGLTLSLVVYGDVYYRKRPYDLAFLSQHSDEVMVMAYDFHKSRGEPGANFPLEGKEKYGYDYNTLVSDLLRDVPVRKITVVYGLYGYDWVVDEQKRPFKPATSMTYAQIQSKYISQCAILNCVVERDDKAYENEINFVDSQTQYHIVWYEDWISVDKKTEYLKQNGITSIAYWAYGYY